MKRYSKIDTGDAIKAVLWTGNNQEEMYRFVSFDFIGGLQNKEVYSVIAFSDVGKVTCFDVDVWNYLCVNENNGDVYVCKEVDFEEYFEECY